MRVRSDNSTSDKYPSFLRKAVSKDKARSTAATPPDDGFSSATDNVDAFLGTIYLLVLSGQVISSQNLPWLLHYESHDEYVGYSILPLHYRRTLAQHGKDKILSTPPEHQQE